MVDDIAHNQLIIFELLDKKIHDRAGFDCGNQSLNNFLLNIASQQQNRHLTSVHVATSQNDQGGKPVYGFYTLCTSEVAFESLPKQQFKGIPNDYTIPSIKLGRLARDKNRTSKGFGSFLLYDALQRILRISKDVGIFLVDVDAKNNNLAEYYKSFGFVALTDSPHSLVMSRSTLDKVISLIQETHIENINRDLIFEK